MKVVCGDQVFDSTETPLLLVLSAADKLSLFKTILENPDPGTYYSVPTPTTPARVQAFVEDATVAVEKFMRRQQKVVRVGGPAVPTSPTEPEAATAPAEEAK